MKNFQSTGKLHSEVGREGPACFQDGVEDTRPEQRINKERSKLEQIQERDVVEQSQKIMQRVDISIKEMMAGSGKKNATQKNSAASSAAKRKTALAVNLPPFKSNSIFSSGSQIEMNNLMNK